MKHRAGWVGGYAPVLGFMIMGIAGAVLLVGAARLDRPSTFSAVGLVWTISTVFGVGVALPFEQLLIRRIAAGAANGIRHAALLALAGVLVSLGVVAYVRTSGSSLDTRPATAAVLASIAAWCVLVPLRARLAGHSALQRYGLCLATEGVTRVVVVVLALLSGTDSILAFGAAVWLPMVAAAALASHWVRPDTGTSGDPPQAQASVFLVACGFQICLNGPVLVLAREAGQAGDAAFGQFLAAATYFRSPALILGGLAVQLLVALGGPSGRTADGRAAYRRVLLRGWAMIGAAAFGAVLASPWLLPLYLGGPVSLPMSVHASLALGTLVACIAYLKLQAALLLNPGWAAGSVWVMAAVVSLVATAIIQRPLHRDAAPLLALALAAGPATAWIGALGASRLLWVGFRSSREGNEASVLEASPGGHAGRSSD